MAQKTIPTNGMKKEKPTKKYDTPKELWIYNLLLYNNKIITKKKKKKKLF